MFDGFWRCFWGNRLVFVVEKRSSWETEELVLFYFICLCGWLLDIWVVFGFILCLSEMGGGLCDF